MKLPPQIAPAPKAPPPPACGGTPTITRTAGDGGKGLHAVPDQRRYLEEDVMQNIPELQEVVQPIVCRCEEVDTMMTMTMQRGTCLPTRVMTLALHVLLLRVR